MSRQQVQVFDSTRRLIAAGCALACAVATAAETPVTWSADNPQTELAGGRVKVTLSDDNKVARLDVTPDDGERIVMGGDAMTFAPDALVAINNLRAGQFVFTNPIKGDGSLKFSGSVTNNVQFKSSTKNVTMLANADLSDYEVSVCGMGWSDTSTSCWNVVPRFVVRSDGTYAAQMQVRVDDQYLRVVKVEFGQSGSDIKALSWDYCYYWGFGKSVENQVGQVDFDQPPSGATKNTYYVNQFIWRHLANEIVISNTVDVTKLVIAGGAAVAVVGDDALASEGTAFSAPVSLQGKLSFRARTERNLELSGAISGRGTLAFESGTNYVLRSTNAAATGNGWRLQAGGAGTNVSVTVKTGKALSPAVTQILSGGEMRWNPPAGSYAHKNAPIRVYDGGVFRALSPKFGDQWGNSNRETKFQLYGGEIDLGGQAATWETPYFNEIVYRDGGTLSGKNVHLTCDNTSSLTVSGTRPALCTLPLLPRGDNATLKSFTFNVADVTGDANYDLKITSELGTMDVNFPYGRFVKTGAGTVLHTGAMTFKWGKTYPMCIKNGTWLAGSASALPSTHPIELDGGAVGVADGVTASTGAVKVDATGGGFVVGKGGTMNIPAPAEGAWDAAAAITVSYADQAARLKVGTAACLTDGQLAQISVVTPECAKPFKARQKADGTIVPARQGLVLYLW